VHANFPPAAASARRSVASGQHQLTGCFQAKSSSNVSPERDCTRLGQRVAGRRADTAHRCPGVATTAPSPQRHPGKIANPKLASPRHSLSLWGFRMRASNRSDFCHCSRNVNVTPSNRCVRTGLRWRDGSFTRSARVSHSSGWWLTSSTSRAN